MSKGSIGKQEEEQVVAGLDVGDRFSELHVLDRAGETVETGKIASTPEGLRQRFGGVARMRVVLEVGTHSLWMSHLLEELGHEVVVANPRQLRLIAQSSRKNDRADAETLARLGGWTWSCCGRCGSGARRHRQRWN